MVMLLAYCHAGGAADLVPEHVSQIAAAAQALPNMPGHASFSVRSSAEGGRFTGELIGRLPVEWEGVDMALRAPSRWCELLLLTPGIGGCSALSGRMPTALEILVLERFDAPSDLGRRHVMTLNRPIERAGYTRLELASASGPRGTYSHRAVIELIELDGPRSAAAVTYTYAYDWEAEIAQRAYDLAQSPDKVGFSIVEDSSPAHRVGGLQGATERHIARLFLAIHAHVALSQSQSDPGRRFAESLAAWLSLIGQYPAQLAEPDPDTYRRIKLRQFGALE